MTDFSSGHLKVRKEHVVGVQKIKLRIARLARAQSVEEFGAVASDKLLTIQQSGK